MRPNLSIYLGVGLTLATICYKVDANEADKRTQAYTAKFRGFANLRNGAELDTNDISGEQASEVTLPGNEGEVGMFFKLQHGAYLTTVLKPSLSASRMTVLRARPYDFDITLMLKGSRTRQPMSIGARVTLNGITQQYYEQNPKLTLRWPIPWSDLSNYADAEGNLVFAARYDIRNPVVERSVVNNNVNWPTGGGSFPMQQPVMQQPVMQQPLMRQPIIQRPIDQRPIDQRPIDTDQMPVDSSGPDDDWTNVDVYDK